MKIFSKIIILIIFINLFLNCTNRERLNPIDPQNSETGGRLQGLSIYSEFDRAVLQWQQLPLKNIQGYRVYRKQDSDVVFTHINLASPDSNEYIDYGLIYDKKYDYFVTVLGVDFETPGSDTVSVIPGPTIIWATDVYNRRILKISHDGAHEIKQIAVDGYPWELAIDHDSGVIWYTDVLLNRVCTIDSQTSKIVASISSGRPIDITLDEKNDRVWIIDETQGKIIVFNRQGEKIGEISGFQQPMSVDHYSEDGSCWVVDSKAGTITKISKSLELVFEIKGLFSPSDISINQYNGDCWVADSSRILNFDSVGKTKLIINRGVNFPTYLAVDSELGKCWVLDLGYFAYESCLICFDDRGEKLIEIPGFSWPENLKVNPYDHSCIVANSGAGQILKIALNGTIIGQVADYDYTRGLIIEF